VSSLDSTEVYRPSGTTGASRIPAIQAQPTPGEWPDQEWKSSIQCSRRNRQRRSCCHPATSSDPRNCCPCKMRMSYLSKVETSPFIGGRGPHGDGATCLEPTRARPARMWRMPRRVTEARLKNRVGTAREGLHCEGGLEPARDATY
jgi:hypothetical protein